MASNFRTVIKNSLPVTCKSTLTESGVLLCHDTAEGEAALSGSNGATNGIGIWMGVAAVSGDEIELVDEGIVPVRVNGQSVNIAKGDMLKVVATTGRLVKAATDKDYYYAKALQASTADGDLIAARLMQGYLSI